MKRSTSSGEQLAAGLGEPHERPGFVHPQPTARDGKLETCAVFGRTAAFFEQEGTVDFLDVDPAVLDGFGGGGDFKQLACRLFRIGKWSVGGELHRLGSTVMCAS